jgi:hypothetical protein
VPSLSVQVAVPAQRFINADVLEDQKVAHRVKEAKRREQPLDHHLRLGNAAEVCASP